MSCGVFPSTEKGGLKFLLLFDRSVLFDCFVYRQVIHMFYTFTNYTFCLKILSQMLLHVEYRFAFILFLAAKTTEGAGNGVFFQIKENKFFSFGEESPFWSGADSLLSCSVLCARQASCRGANFLQKAGHCYLLRNEMQTSSAAGWLLERDGSFYLKKVFHIFFVLHVIVFG